MAEEGSGELLGGDAAAVVGDPDEGHAAALQLHHHGGRAGVDGVFHELFDHAGGPLHHLAGGDEVRHVGGELLDVGHRGGLLFPLFPCQYSTERGRSKFKLFLARAYFSSFT